MLSNDRLLEIFHEYFPATGRIAVIEQGRQEYVEHALRHPFIRMQIDLGLYDEDNFADQFTGWARSHTELGLVVVCTELGQAVLEGIPDDIAEQYTRDIVQHELRHFQNDHRPQTAQEHLRSESECVDHEHDSPATEYVNTHSPLFIRLHAAISAVKSKHNL